MREYFEIIRKALSENRIKGEIYYEAHHILPKSFDKQSSLVLLTPEEHYQCHKILAEQLGRHSVYGQKMLWAFHRLAYDRQRKLTAEEYAEARKVLMPLWSRKKTEEHKRKIAEAQKGNTNNKSRVYKGMKSTMSEKGRKKLAKIVKERQTGKNGLQANASKGAVILEYENGRILEAGSALQLSKLSRIPQPTLSYRLIKYQGVMKEGFRVSYKS